MKRSCVERKRKFPFDPERELRYPARRRKFPFDPAVEVERRRPCQTRLQALFKDEIQVGREGAVVRDDDQVLVVPLNRDEEFHLARVDYFHGILGDSAMAQIDLSNDGHETDFLDKELLRIQPGTWLTQRVTLLQRMWRARVALRRASQLRSVFCNRCHDPDPFFIGIAEFLGPARRRRRRNRPFATRCL